MSSSVTVESLTESFPHPTVETIPDRPSYEAIATAHKLLNRNAASIPSELGGGQHGYLAITLSPTVYAGASNTAFVTPTNPGPNAAFLVNPTQAQIRAIERNYNERKRVWREYNTLQDALKNQLSKAVKPICIEGLANRHTGFANVTIRDMLDHLHARYGDITPFDLEENDKLHKAAYDPSTPIEQLFRQLEDTVQHADAGNQPYSPEQVLNTAYSILFKTGIFRDSCREWRNKPQATKTFDNFKTHFTVAWQDNLNENLLTSQGAGYHSANVVTDNPTVQWATETAEAFANLATATASDRSTIAASVATNKELTATLAQKDLEIARSQTQLNNTTRRTSTDQTRRNRLPDNTNYCWTHGWIAGNAHTSETCANPAPGHQKTATRQNTMNATHAAKTKWMQPLPDYEGADTAKQQQQ